MFPQNLRISSEISTKDDRLTADESFCKSKLDIQILLTVDCNVHPSRNIRIRKFQARLNKNFYTNKANRSYQIQSRMEIKMKIEERTWTCLFCLMEFMEKEKLFFVWNFLGNFGEKLKKDDIEARQWRSLVQCCHISSINNPWKFIMLQINDYA